MAGEPIMSLKLTEAGAIGEDGTASKSLRPRIVDARLQEMTQPTVKNRNGPSGQEQSGSHGSGKGSSRLSGPLIQTTLVERWKQWTGNGPRTIFFQDGTVGRTVGATTGDLHQNPPTGLQLGDLRSTWSPRTAPPPVLGSAEVEADAGGAHRPLITTDNAPGMPPSNATDQPKDDRQRLETSLPSQGRRDEVDMVQKVPRA